MTAILGRTLLVALVAILSLGARADDPEKWWGEHSWEFDLLIPDPTEPPTVHPPWITEGTGWCLETQGHKFYVSWGNESGETNLSPASPVMVPDGTGKIEIRRPPIPGKADWWKIYFETQFDTPDYDVLRGCGIGGASVEVPRGERAYVCACAISGPPEGDTGPIANTTDSGTSVIISPLKGMANKIDNQVDACARGCEFTKLSEAAAFVAAQSPTATNRWTIYVPAGVFDTTTEATAAIPSYTTLRGAGKWSSMVTRTKPAATSSIDMIIDLDDTIGVHIENIWLNNQGHSDEGSDRLAVFNGSNIEQLHISDSVLQGTSYAFRAVESQAFTEATHLTDLVRTHYYRNSDFIGRDLWSIELYRGHHYFIGCRFEVAHTDTPVATSLNVLKFWEVPIARIYDSVAIGKIGTATYSNILTRHCVMCVVDTVNAYLRMTGGNVVMDLSAGDTNHSNATAAAVFVGGADSIDSIGWFDGVDIAYKTGTVTSAHAVAGVLVGFKETDGSSVKLHNVTIRDLGGSGGTTRADLAMIVDDSVGLDEPTEVSIMGSLISSVAYAPFGSPSPTVSKHVWQPNEPQYQSGTVTFATAATASVTLPIALPTGHDDYLITVTGNVEETFWVTSKGNTGFTINSSNASSTAVVDWFLRKQK
jgi:hypothetical protein